MRRTLYVLVGAAIGSSVVGYLRSSGILVILASNALVWLFVGIYWLGRWQAERERVMAQVTWRRNWFYEI